jgi:predicted cytidylate kinase
MIITIGGNIGAGKSTIAPLIAQALGYEHFYMGGIFRAMAKDKGVSIEEFYRKLEKDPDLERSVDEEQIALMKENGHVVIQGRTSFFFAKRSGKPSINIFFAVDPVIGAERKIKEGIYPGRTVEEVMAIHRHREADERKHYLNLYEIVDFLDRKHYNLIIDTSHMSIEEVTDEVLGQLRKRM